MSMKDDVRQQGFTLLDEAIRTGDGDPFFKWMEAHVRIDMDEVRRIFGLCIEYKNGDRAIPPRAEHFGAPGQ